MFKNAETRTVVFEDKKINYLLIRKKVKNVNLRIKSDLTIYVSANQAVSKEYIDKFVLSNSDFILKSLDNMKKSYPVRNLPVQYKNGERINFLGESLLLVITESTTQSLVYDGYSLNLFVKDTNNIVNNQKQVEKWIFEQCKKIFTIVMEESYKKFINYNIPYATLKIRKMSSRWGSCHTLKHSITLNSKLIEYPIPIIEYVVVHEFCHFIHPNHSKDFNNLVEYFIPDWKTRKKALNKKY